MAKKPLLSAEAALCSASRCFKSEVTPTVLVKKISALRQIDSAHSQQPVPLSVVSEFSYGRTCDQTMDMFPRREYAAGAVTQQSCKQFTVP
jgi:hypothetical protein